MVFWEIQKYVISEPRVSKMLSAIFFYDSYFSVFFVNAITSMTLSWPDKGLIDSKCNKWDMVWNINESVDTSQFLGNANRSFSVWGVCACPNEIENNAFWNPICLQQNIFFVILRKVSIWHIMLVLHKSVFSKQFLLCLIVLGEHRHGQTFCLVGPKSWIYLTGTDEWSVCDSPHYGLCRKHASMYIDNEQSTTILFNHLLLIKTQKNGWNHFRTYYYQVSHVWLK